MKHLQVKVQYHCIGIDCDGSDETSADFVIVTTPAPLTTGIHFKPEINFTQWHSFRLLHYARPVKVGLAFNEQWWKSEKFAHITLEGGIQSDLNFFEMYFPPVREIVEKGESKYQIHHF